MTLTDFYVTPTEEHPVAHRFLGGLRLPATAEPPSAERKSFAVLSDSGELPVAFVEEERPRPETTARIVLSSTAAGPPPEPRRPWFYRGVRRWTRSHDLLTIATWPGGAR